MPPGIGYNRNAQQSAPSYGGGGRQRGYASGAMGGPSVFGPQRPAQTAMDRLNSMGDGNLVVGPGGQLVRVPRGQAPGLMDLYPNLTPEQALYIQSIQGLQQQFGQGTGMGGGVPLGGGLFFGGL